MLLCIITLNLFYHLLLSVLGNDLLRYCFLLLKQQINDKVMRLIVSFPSPLINKPLYCRYTFFIVLYPMGVTGELLTIYAALPYVQKTGLYSVTLPNKYNFSFDYYTFLILIMISYIPRKSKARLSILPLFICRFFFLHQKLINKCHFRHLVLKNICRLLIKHAELPVGGFSVTSSDGFLHVAKHFSLS